MANAKFISIEVAYASTSEQRILSLQVEDGTSIETAIDRSGMLDLFPEIDLMKQKIGIFSKPKKLTDTVQEGDRIEIYRPLLIDPKEARRGRAVKKIISSKQNKGSR